MEGVIPFFYRKIKKNKIRRHYHSIDDTDAELMYSMDLGSDIGFSSFPPQPGKTNCGSSSSLSQQQQQQLKTDHIIGDVHKHRRSKSMPDLQDKGQGPPVMLLQDALALHAKPPLPGFTARQSRSNSIRISNQHQSLA